MTLPTAFGCDQVRLALSCRIDGEEPGLSPDGLQTHLDMCAGCREWLNDADELARLFSAQPARTSDLAEAILKAVAADQTSWVRGDRYRSS